jgi:hypothetical protein
MNDSLYCGGRRSHGLLLGDSSQAMFEFPLPPDLLGFANVGSHVHPFEECESIS